MSLVAPLLADGIEDIGAVIGIIVAILVFVVPAVLQALNKAGKQQQPRRRLPRQAAPRPVAGGVEDEIGEFLRRAAKQRGVPQQGLQVPVEAQIVAEPVEVGDRPVGGRVARQVQEDLDTGEFRRRAGQLGAEVGLADEKMAGRLEDVFDHKLGTLAGTPGESAETPVLEAVEPGDVFAELPPTAAAGLAALLSNADSVRTAVILNEILTPPAHRWS